MRKLFLALVLCPTTFLIAQLPEDALRYGYPLMGGTARNQAIGGAMVSLHSRSGGSADNIIKTYNFTNNLNLKTLKGQKVQGTWKLKISDVAGQDIGKLNKWSLKLVKE